MNNTKLTALLAIWMIIAALLGYHLAIFFTVPLIGRPSIPTQIPPREVIELFVIEKTIVSFISMSLIIFLLSVYLDIYRKMQTRFTLSLVTMLILLLMYAITSNPLLHTPFGFQAIGLGPFSVLPDIFTTIALLILFYLSLE